MGDNGKWETRYRRKDNYPGGLAGSIVVALHYYFKDPNINSLSKKFMIRECEVKYRISNELPALAIELSYIRDENDIYKAIECLTTHTSSLIREDRVNEVEQCFEMAYELLHEGNRLVQLAIENIFIFSVSHLLEVSLSVAQPVRKLFLENFRKEYCKQINSQYP
jgi:hypothetical protein